MRLITAGTLLCLMALTGLQSSSSFPFGISLDSITSGESHVRVKRLDEEKTKTVSLTPTLDQQPKITWVIDSEGKDPTATLVDLKDATTVSTAGGINDDVAQPTTATATPIGESDAQKLPKENTVPFQQTMVVDDKNAPEDITEAFIIIDATHDLTPSDSDTGSNGNAEVDTYVNRCMRVRCTPPPARHNCKEGGADSTAPPLTGLTNDCCPIHSCQREDGSTYLHYAIEVDEEPTSFQTPPQEKHSFVSSFSFSSGDGNTNKGFPSPPPRPSNLPPFISSFLPPIFPFLPPPSSFYNQAGSSRKQHSSSSGFPSHNVPSSVGGLIFPPLSGGVFRPSTSSSSFQIIVPPSQNSNRFPSIFPPSSGQRQPRQQPFSRQASSDSGDSPIAALDRFVRNIAVENGGPAPVSRFDSFVASSGPFGFSEEPRARRNAMTFEPIFGAGAGFVPNRPGSASPFNGLPMFQL